jgi:6-pyruvoyltetrahydropterin/6-carboxytetrahydropterin synthase
MPDATSPATWDLANSRRRREMQRFQVTKLIEFSYGHRLIGHGGKCRFLHGHNGMLEIDVAAGALDSLGMVVDFSSINELVKEWVNENLDHRMLLRRDDPVVEGLLAAGEPLFLMDDNPTAENIAKLVWQAARTAGLQVSEVRLWETSTSRACYSGEPWTE